MATVRLDKVNKVYDGGVHAVHDFSLDIKDKEFIVFVGPSGCGKSTTLRMIAGLEEISYGELYIDDRLMNNAAPKDRDIAMVFQSYALYPQMTVYDNMAYALKLRKVPRDEIDKRVRSTAEILKLTDYLDRKPRALSGGQRQRVALGRSIVRRPKVFLMDEPLSNLDAKLRVAMRSEIVRIHNEVGATTIYVTHDQIEAMTMASRIVVMRDGYIQQIGTPEELYSNPVNMFVAGFMGTPAMNFLHGTISGKYFLPDDSDCQISLTDEQSNLLKNYQGKRIVYGIRPENLINKHSSRYEQFSYTAFDMKCKLVEKLGDVVNVHGKIGSSSLIIKMNSKYLNSNNNTMRVAIDTEYVKFFNESTTKAITQENCNYEEAPVVQQSNDQQSTATKKQSVFDKIKVSILSLFKRKNTKKDSEKQDKTNNSNDSDN